MGRLNELLQELGVSKVRLAKYLGVSRQMIYNYLELKAKIRLINILAENHYVVLIFLLFLCIMNVYFLL